MSVATPLQVRFTTVSNRFVIVLKSVFTPVHVRFISVLPPFYVCFRSSIVQRLGNRVHISSDCFTPVSGYPLYVRFTSVAHPFHLRLTSASQRFRTASKLSHTGYTRSLAFHTRSTFVPRPFHVVFMAISLLFHNYSTSFVYRFTAGRTVSTCFTPVSSPSIVRFTTRSNNVGIAIQPFKPVHVRLKTVSHSFPDRFTPVSTPCYVGFTSVLYRFETVFAFVSRPFHPRFTIVSDLDEIVVTSV